MTSNTDINPDRKIYINPTNVSSTIPANILPSESKSNFPANNSEYHVDIKNSYLINYCENAPSSQIVDNGDDHIDPDLAMDIATSVGLYYPLFDEVRDYMDKRTLYQDLVDDISFRNSNTTLNAFYNTKQAENLGKIYASDKSISNLLADSLVNTDSLLFAAKLAAAKTANNTILVSAHNYENWEKFLNNVYLNMLENGLSNIDSATRLQIGYIAQQCPAAVGPCVYKARSMFANLVPGMQYYDDIACAAVLPMNKNSKNPYTEEDDLLNSGNAPITKPTLALGKIVIYPNPISKQNYFNLQYNLVADTDLKCEIFDLTGKKLKIIYFSGKEGTTAINIDGLANGVYQVKVSNSSKQYVNDKLEVIN